MTTLKTSLLLCLAIAGCRTVGNEEPVASPLAATDGNVTASGERGVELLLGYRITTQAIEYVVFSGGCTDRSNFELLVRDTRPLQVVLVRKKADTCDRLAQRGTRVRFDLGAFGLSPDVGFVVANPVRTQESSGFTCEYLAPQATGLTGTSVGLRAARHRVPGCSDGFDLVVTRLQDGGLPGIRPKVSVTRAAACPTAGHDTSLTVAGGQETDRLEIVEILSGAIRRARLVLGGKAHALRCEPLPS